jgi:hypothetical protein
LSDPGCLFCTLSASLFSFSSFLLPLKERKTQKLDRNFDSIALSDPGAAEDDVAVVEHGSLAGRDSTLWSAKRYACGSGAERLDGGGRGFMLVADFGEGAQWRGRRFAGNPIHAFDFAY